MGISIDIEEVRRLTDGGATLVEVLPEDDHRQLHLPGALSLPLEDMNAKSAEQLDRSRPVIVYCNDFL